jgi:hypothetical protein
MDLSSDIGMDRALDVCGEHMLLSPSLFDKLRVVNDEEVPFIKAVIISFDTEFAYIAEGGEHVTNQRLSFGCKVLLEMNDSSFRLVSPLLEPDLHVIITDWQEMVLERELKVKAERSESWANTIDDHPQNKFTDRRTERNAIIELIDFFKNLKKDFPAATRFVLRGHYATTVDIPAICALGLRTATMT